jgi:ribosome-binding factor A
MSTRKKTRPAVAGARGGAGRRVERVGRAVRAVIAELLLREARDPAMAAVVVTDVKLTADLSLARVYYRLLLGEDALAKGRRAAERGLRRATGWIRAEVGNRIELRIVPELEFHYDEGQDRAMRVNELLKDIGAGTGAAAVPADDAPPAAARRDEEDLDDSEVVDDDDDDDDEGYGEPPEDED